tara:strand:+ start:273 stop:833 length:561 start_codon:yes stop_codon:yes gene_type:complete
MSRAIDALIAARLIKLLVTPFKRTKAYELGIIDDKGKVLIKSKDIPKKFPTYEVQKARKAYTLLIRFVFNLKRLLSKVGIRGPIGSAAAAAIAFLKEEYPNNLYVEQEVYKYLKEQGFEFDISEDYGEPLVEGEYKVKHDIYNLDGDIIINSDENILYTNTTHNIMGYDVFKYKDVYLTTEDLYVN